MGFFLTIIETGAGGVTNVFVDEIAVTVDDEDITVTVEDEDITVIVTE